MPRVTAILVARDQEAGVEAALRALRAQRRAPDAVVAVDAGSTDGTAGVLTSSAADLLASAPAVGFGEAATVGTRALPPAGPDEWIWLLPGDSVAEPGALTALLAAVEKAPSVGIAGPKVVHVDDPRTLRSYGVSVARSDETVPLIDSELDQGQYDDGDDVMAVSLTGALVRRDLWEALGGPDPALRTVDAGLDLGMRARLAGSRVVRVAAARVARSGRVEDFGRRRPTGSVGRHYQARRARLHRRMVAASALALPFVWLSLLPVAIGRSVWRLLAKQPAAVPAELAAALAVALADPGIAAARRRLTRASSQPRSVLAPLRVPAVELRRRRKAAPEVGEPIVRAEFFSGGAPWIVGAALLTSIVAFWRLLGATTVTGGGLAPLSSDVASLWRSALEGSTLEPFRVVLAVLGSLWPPNPSAALVALWVLALPLAALGAWWCATRVTERAAGPILAAIAWCLAPPFLAALGDGRLGAVLAHLVLPWLVLAGIEARRSWSAAATASILMAATVACAPSLGPALAVAWLGWLALHPRGIPRLIGVPILSLVLMAPLALVQLSRGTPLDLLADPGIPLAFRVPSGAGLAVLEPSAGSSGWAAFAAQLGHEPVVGSIVAAVLLAPIALLALAGLFLPGSRRRIPPLVLALAGLLTAVVAVRIPVSFAGADAVAVWPGSGLSLYWLGIVLAAASATQALRRFGPVAVAITAVCCTALGAPLVVRSTIAQDHVTAGAGPELPPLVVASAASQPRLATLVLDAADDGSLLVQLQTGSGTTLDERSVATDTTPGLDADRRSLARLAGNLASSSGVDPDPLLRRFGIGFVVLEPSRDGESESASALRDRVGTSLDGTAALEQVARTADRGTLWQDPDAKQPPAVAPDTSPTRAAYEALLAAIVLIALLLAIPTARRRRVVTGDEDELRTDDFAEDVDD